MAKHLWGVSKPVSPITGLIFPSNGEADNDIRFVLTGADLLDPFPATYIWRVNNVQQNGYYTNFFWGPDGSFTGAGYYGFHPYPDSPPSGSTHKYEISANGADYVTGSPAITVDAWRTQAAVVTNSGGNVTLTYYYDLSSLSNKIETTFNGYAAGFPPAGTPALIWGGAPWNTGNECLSGTLRGIQVYNSALSEANIAAAAALNNDADVLALGLDPWYLNMNPTPSDISDKSGNGHDPAWSTANRPTLYTA
jgi:hypothetical protein